MGLAPATSAWWMSAARRTSTHSQSHPLGQVVVERVGGGGVGVSRARRFGAGGDGGLDGARGAGDIEQPVRLGAADANWELGPSIFYGLLPSLRIVGVVWGVLMS